MPAFFLFVPNFRFYGENIDKTSLKNQIHRLIKPVVESEDMELVDVEYKSGPTGLLRIFIDKAGGVNLSDCSKISSRVGILLEIEDVIEDKYKLEVSSPGLDRPLKNEVDYKRNKGKLVRIFLHKPLGGKKEYIGRIIDFKNQQVSIKEKSGKTVNVLVFDIARGKLEIEF